MSQKDLNRELRTSIADLTKDKEELLEKIKSKESRIKQILIQLEQSTEDVAACGKKIREQEDRIKDLENQIRAFESAVESTRAEVEALIEETKDDSDDTNKQNQTANSSPAEEYITEWMKKFVENSHILCWAICRPVRLHVRLRLQKSHKFVLWKWGQQNLTHVSLNCAVSTISTKLMC
jgi:septal ring factor EnvC (AmiA/AmiB activator)